MEALSSPSEWKGPTTGPKPIAGKRVAIIPCGLITEGCNRPARAATEAAKTIGWVPTVLDGQADTGKQLAAINAAVDGKYDAIDHDPDRSDPGQRGHSEGRSPPIFPS